MITSKEIEHLATLSRIEIPKSDQAALAKEFESILGYIDQLKKADVKMDAEGRIGAVKNVMRTDEIRSISEKDRARLLDESPDREGDFIAVKKIIAQD